MKIIGRIEGNELAITSSVTIQKLSSLEKVL